MSDKIVIMNKGHIEQISTPTEKYNNPESTIVAGFVGKNNIIEFEGKTIAVRPEHIRVTDTKVEGNCIKGTVTQSAFQGTHYFTHFETECGFIMAQVPAEMILNDGQEVWLSWEKSNLF